MTTLTVVLVSLLLATPVVISWLWLVIVPYRVSKLCPEECSCDVEGYLVDCSKTSLHNIPSIELTHVQKLVLNYNNITSLKNDSFISKGLNELSILLLQSSRLQTIEVGAFNGLTKLTHLSLRRNEIGEITRGTFGNMSGLEFLRLQYNKIEHLDGDVFYGLINLQHINLEGNELLDLHPGIFVGLPFLQSLYLSYNPDLQIPTDHHFITSHSLKRLYISHCSVRSVSFETFANVSALETLDLSYNKLRSVDINILKALPKLSSIYLNDNPLHCDCQLKEVWRWCQDHNIATDSVSGIPKNYTWFEGKVKCWWVLEELQCVLDNASNNVEYKQKHRKYPDDEIEQKYKQYITITIHVLTALVLFLSIIGAIGNVIILIIIICNKDMRTLPNMYILNLALSDTIYLTSEILGNIVDFSSEFSCMVILFGFRMLVGVSTYSVAVLSIQRYRVIVNPLNARLSSQRTWRLVVAIIVGVWIVSALIAIPSVLSKFRCFHHSMSIQNVAYYKRVVVFELFVSCAYPVCVIAFTYIMTARHLVKCSFPISAETQNPKLNTRKNAAKVVVGLTVVFFLTYVPIHLCFTIYVFSVEWIYREFDLNNMSPIQLETTLYIMELISNFLLLINSCFNPVAIFYISSAFREHVKRFLTCFCKANSSPTNIELTRRN
jgi:hypothetical protein